jgi:Tfp pilus assembly protein PilF/predicted Ser/Thr protein kinase
MIGQTLGHYRIESKLGAGGMGVVYRARDTMLQRTVALKVLGEQYSADESARARLLEEARSASALNHPSICTIHEVGEQDGRTFIVMEYVEGRPLNALAAGEGLPVKTLLRYGAQIAEALAHAHERGVVHRDLKGANIIVTPQGRAKVLDFGLARRLRSADVQDATRSQVTLEEAGAMGGTLAYMPPEVQRGEGADERGDIWALGVVLHEMTAGGLPFKGQTGFELCSAILREPAAPLAPSTPAGLRNIIHRCLEKEPGQRYQRASEVRAALEAIQPEAVQPAPAPVKKRPWLWALGAAVVAVALIGVAWNVLGRRQAGAPAAPSGPLLSTGAPASPNKEANEHFERGIMFLRLQGQLGRTREALERALALDPRFAEARGWYGFTHALMINYGYSSDAGWLYKAEEELRRAAQDDPASARVHSALAAVYVLQGRKELAPAEIEKALRARPDDIEALMWRLQYLRLNGDTSAARALAQQIVERQPLFGPARRVLALILREQGDAAAAIRELEKVLEQAPGDVQTILGLAQVYFEQGEVRKARQALERWDPTRRQNYAVRLGWAMQFALEGKRQEALKEMDAEVLKYGGTFYTPALPVAEFYSVLGDTDKALEWLDKTVRLGDDRAEWFRRDPLLAKIRNQPRFQQILESIAYRRQQQAAPKR